jgi:hypothetical protein
MDSSDRHPQQRAAKDTHKGRPALGSRFRYVPPPDDRHAQERSTLPGIYRVTFPVCDAWAFGDTCRLFIRMVITGPLESEAPRDIVNELDIADTFEAVREEFMALQIPLESMDDLDDARAKLLQAVHYMHKYYYLDSNLQRVLEKEHITAKEAEARLHGHSSWSRRLRMRPAHKSKGEKHRNLREQSRALQQESRRPVTVWATIIRCDALPLEDAVGHEVAWEAYIDDYVGAPRIHRWWQRVDSVQAYEELRRDLDVLCVELDSYADIEKACRTARGQRIIADLPLIDIGDGKACLLAHFTKKEHQLPPIHERMTRAEAHDYCRQHGLAAFAGDLETTHFIDEVPDKSKSRALPAMAEDGPAAAQPSVASVSLDEAGQPMKALFGHILDSYKLLQSPVEPHASNPIAPEGTFWLKATHCTVRKTGSHYHAQIRLVLYNHDLDPPFEAVYEQDRELTFEQLQQEFRKLQVFLNHPSAVQQACNSAIRTIGYANCLPDDAPAWMNQEAETN